MAGGVLWVVDDDGLLLVVDGVLSVVCDGEFLLVDGVLGESDVVLENGGEVLWLGDVA